MTQQAIILAGGKGTRLAERLEGRPKPLIDIDGTPLLGRQLELLSRHGFIDVVILVNHAADQVVRFCKESAFSHLSIRFVNDGDPKGTAGSLLAARDQLHDRFLVMYGDTLVNVDLRRLCEHHETSGADATLFLHPNDHPYDSDLVEVDDEDWITRFHSYPHDPQIYLPNLVNAGLYVIERRALEQWSNFHTPSDIAKELFPAMITSGVKLKGYRSFEYIKDIGTPDRLDMALGDLRSGRVRRAEYTHQQKAVLVDRDGTLNEERDHLCCAEDLTLFPGTAQAVKVLNEAEYRVVLITNQPVLARGECTYSEMRRIHNRLETELGRHHAIVDGIYLCPHHPHSGYPREVPALKIECDCRKPNIGLLKRAQSDLHIDFSQSWFIGDTTADMLTATRAGVRSILVQTGYAGADGKYIVDPDYIVRDFQAATELIVDVYPKLVDEARRLIADVKPGDVALIGGLAQQGKSTLTATLKSELQAAGRDPVVLHLDHFIKSIDQRGAGLLGRFDLLSAGRVVAPWLAKPQDYEITIPHYDRMKRTSLEAGGSLKLKQESVLLIEGVPAFLMELPISSRVHRIFVDGPEAERRDRVIEDLILRGTPFEEATRIYVERCHDEAALVLGLRPLAEKIFSFPVIRRNR